jgi:thioredoxin 1
LLGHERSAHRFLLGLARESSKFCGGAQSSLGTRRRAESLGTLAGTIRVPLQEEIVSDNLLTLNEANFDETLVGADTPVLVDFWAEWCGPCKTIAPILEQIAVERADQIKIGKLNVDDNLGIQARFDVMSIPTLILFKGGEPILRLVGAKGKGQLLEELDRYL